MAFILYGVKKANIGVDEVFSYCPSCEADTFQDILVTSNYYHFYYIPVFPIEKEVTFICNKCGLKRIDVPLTERAIKNYAEVNRKFRHPWYTYFVTLLVASFVAIAILINITSDAN